MLQGLVANQGDGWKWMLEELERYYESNAQETVPAEELSRPVEDAGPMAVAQASAFACDRAGVALNAAAVLGKRTAEMHLALGILENKRGIFSRANFRRVSGCDCRPPSTPQAARGYELLKKTMSGLADDTVELAAFLLSRRTRTLDGLGFPS